MSSRGNIALFVPHRGCPCRCSFCDQRAITGAAPVPDAQAVQQACKEGLAKSGGRRLELAFFGGSFTAVEPALMTELLEAAQPFLRQGLCGIRISTRPDCVEQPMLAWLKQYGVTAIELGAQSMDDMVLKKNQRGHTAAQTVQAANRVRQNGFALGLQMMTGLPGADVQSDMATAQALIALQPATVRIYPTVVFENTELYNFYLNKTYTPQTLEQAVALCATLLECFLAADIAVIRLGLHATPELLQQAVAGPLHPAFGELCQAQLMLLRLLPQLPPPPSGPGQVLVNPVDVSKWRGHGQKNLHVLRQMGHQVQVLPCQTVPPLQVQYRYQSMQNKKETEVLPCV